MNYSEDRVVDEFLVMRCQTGDREALSVLISKWQPPFLRYASVMTRDEDLAADVLQEAWLKIIRALPGLRDPLRFPAWAYRIINNQCLDALRRKGNREPDTGVEVVTPIRDLEVKQQVNWILSQLTPEHRSVLALHYLQGFAVDEIAEIVRKPAGTVKSRLFNAREKFRDIFLETEQSSIRGDEDERSGLEDPGHTGSRYRPA